MNGIALTAIVVYLVAATAAGSLMARRAKSSADWAVASSGMSTSMIAFGIAGTRIGGAGTYGVAGGLHSGRPFDSSLCSSCRASRTGGSTPS